jgi:cobalt-zinc-cadmium resistance protein CzcA
MVEGAALVALVLWLFLRALSGSVAVAVTMPLALLSAFAGLHFAGVPANMMSVGAIDFGILLDGAVILVENVYRHLAQHQPTPAEVPDVVAKASKEVVRPILFSLSIIVAAMLPVFTLERVEGRIFRPVALTFAFALAGALFFTLCSCATARCATSSRGFWSSCASVTWGHCAGRSSIQPSPASPAWPCWRWRSCSFRGSAPNFSPK